MCATCMGTPRVLCAGRGASHPSPQWAIGTDLAARAQDSRGDGRGGARAERAHLVEDVFAAAAAGMSLYEISSAL